MVTNNSTIENDFANLLRAKAPALSDEEISDCYIAITKCVDNYLNLWAFQNDINKPALARESLSNVATSIKTLINQLRVLDSTSQIHLVSAGFKSRSAQTTLENLHKIVIEAEQKASSQRDKPANDHLTYLVGRIHSQLGKVLAPYKKRSTKKLVNDIFALVAHERLKSAMDAKKTKTHRLSLEESKGIIPIDIGRNFDKALKLVDIISD